MMIALRYRWSITKIVIRLKWNLLRLWVAGNLLKLAVFISPALGKQLGIRR